jgi:hypothetical protein
MRNNAFVAVLLCGLSGWGWAADRPQTSRRKLEQITEIQGYSCTKSYAWFYADGRLERCFVSKDTKFGEVQVPSGSIIVLRPDGKPEYAMLEHDSWLLGYHCRGGGPLGPAEGAMTTFYPSGRLKLCWLVADQEIQGVPCASSGGFFFDMFHHGGWGTWFYGNGKLHKCYLAHDFESLKKGQEIVRPPDVH